MIKKLRIRNCNSDKGSDLLHFSNRLSFEVEFNRINYERDDLGIDSTGCYFRLDYR